MPLYEKAPARDKGMGHKGKGPTPKGEKALRSAAGPGETNTHAAPTKTGSTSHQRTVYSRHRNAERDDSAGAGPRSRAICDSSMCVLIHEYYLYRTCAPAKDCLCYLMVSPQAMVAETNDFTLRRACLFKLAHATKFSTPIN